MNLFQRIKKKYDVFILKYIIQPNKKPSMSLFQFLKLKLILRPKRIINEIGISKFPLPSKEYEFLNSIMNSFDSKIVKLDDILPIVRKVFAKWVITKDVDVKHLEDELHSELSPGNSIVFYEEDKESIREYTYDIESVYFRNSPIINLGYFLEKAKYKKNKPTNMKLYKHFKRKVINFRHTTTIRGLIYNYFNDTFGCPIYNIIEEDDKFLFEIWYDKKHIKRGNVYCKNCGKTIFRNISSISINCFNQYSYGGECDKCKDEYEQD